MNYPYCFSLLCLFIFFPIEFITFTHSQWVSTFISAQWLPMEKYQLSVFLLMCPPSCK